MELFELVETTRRARRVRHLHAGLRAHQRGRRLRLDRGLSRRGQRRQRHGRRGAAAVGHGRPPERDDQGARHRGRRARRPHSSSRAGSTSTSRCCSPSRRIGASSRRTSPVSRIACARASRSTASRRWRRSSSAASTRRSTSGSTRSPPPRRASQRDRILALRGKAAIANAQLAYKLFREEFSSPRWAPLKAAGARLQRPLWASTSSKNPAYRDVLYVEQLIGPDTVNTMPPATIDAFRDHGEVARTVDAAFAVAERTIAELGAVGVDLRRRDGTSCCATGSRASRRASTRSSPGSTRRARRSDARWRRAAEPPRSRRGGEHRRRRDSSPTFPEPIPVPFPRTKIVCTLGPSTAIARDAEQPHGSRAERRPPQLLPRHARAARARRSTLVRATARRARPPGRHPRRSAGAAHPHRRSRRAARGEGRRGHRARRRRGRDGRASSRRPTRASART